jgi:hypothetical protein
VTVTIPGSEPEKITGTFSTADEAWRWIKNESASCFTRGKNDWLRADGPPMQRV